MNITRSEIIAAIAGAFAGVAAITSVTAAVNAPNPVGVAEYELGKTTQVADWSHTPKSTFTTGCTVSGTVTYEVEGPKDLTGIIRGSIDFEHGTEFVTGTMVNGEGEVRVNVAKFNDEEVCSLKKASDLEVEELQISVIPAVVSAID